MLAVVYRRVSTDEQASKGYSLQSQWEACQSRAIACGATEVIDCCDEGVPGDVLNRPGLDAARQLVREGRACLFVVYDPDRLARKLTLQLLVTEEIERHGARLEFVNFEWRATPEGRLFYSLRGAIAEYEKAKIAERTGRGRLAKARRGLLPVAAPAYGYRYVDSRLEVHSDEARWVRAIYRWAAAEQLGLNRIADRLNDLGAPTRRGGTWRPQTVRGILTNPTYTGVFHANRYETHGVGHNRFVGPGEKARRRLRPENDWIPIEVPALIDPAAWNRVQRLRAEARRKWCGRGAAPNRYLLSGLVVCGVCGRPMRGFPSRGRLYYQCGSKWAGAPCSNRLANARDLDAAVWEQVQAWLSHPDAAVPLAPAPDTGEADLIAAQLGALDREGETVLRLARRQLTSLEQAEQALTEIQDRRSRLRQRLDEVRHRPDEVRHHLDEARQRPSRGPAEAPAAWLQSLPFADRRRAVRALIVRAVYTPDSTRLEARIPPSVMAMD